MHASPGKGCGVPGRQMIGTAACGSECAHDFSIRAIAHGGDCAGGLVAWHLQAFQEEVMEHHGMRFLLRLHPRPSLV